MVCEGIGADDVAQANLRAKAVLQFSISEAGARIMASGHGICTHASATSLKGKLLVHREQCFSYRWDVGRRKGDSGG